MSSNYDAIPESLEDAINAFENNIHYVTTEEHKARDVVWRYEHDPSEARGTPWIRPTEAEAIEAREQSGKRVKWFRDVLAQLIAPYAKSLGLDPQPYADFLYDLERGNYPGESEAILIRNSRRMLLEIQVRHGEVDDGLMSSHARERTLPKWNDDSRELSLDGKVVRKYSDQAKNCILVLREFQRLEWPQRLDDPLLHDSDVDPVGRVYRTCDSLNRNLHRLQFHAGDGGKAFVWSLLELVMK